MATESQINLFDNESDTAMYKHKLTLEKIRNELINFGLTKSQAKVFIYLGKYGSKTASEIAEFIDFVNDNDIKVIFAEELVDPRLAEVIADEAGAQVMIFSPLEALTPDEASEGVTFLEKMEQNLDALKVALECQ